MCVVSNEPHCEKEENVKILIALVEHLGVDLSDVL